MSKTKKRNRNIQSLSALDKFSNFPHPDNHYSNSLKRKEDLFGEHIKTDFTPPFYKPEYDAPFYNTKWSVDDDIDIESVTSGLNEIKLVKSLSSSPSWSDDNDSDGSRKVQDELERMDRVLRGLDPIPPHYDMDEYKQWMGTFPNLSLFEKRESGTNKTWKNKKEDNPTKSTSNKTETASHALNIKQYREEIKRAVIHNIYENITTRLNNGSQIATPSTKLRKPHNDNKTQSFLKDCLRRSPFTPVIDRHRKKCFITRHNSREDEIEESPEFESLPSMWENPNKEPIFTRYKNESLKALSRRKSKKNIILPPIEKKLNSTNQFRSISATPTYSSFFSAKSMKLGNKFSSRNRTENASEY